MAEKVTLDLEVNGEGASVATKNLKTQIKEAQNEAQVLADKYGETSKEAIKAYKNTAVLKEKLADVKQTINALHPEEKFNAVAGAVQGIAGGFAAAEGAMALFGAESADVQRQLMKVQGALALSQGINQVMGLGDAFKNLKIVIGQTAIVQRIMTVAQVAYNFVTSGTNVLMKILRASMLAVPIFLIIAGVALLIANFEKLSKWVKDNSDKIKELAIMWLKFGNPVGLIITAITELGKRFQFIQVVIDAVKQKFTVLAGAVIKLLEDLNLLDTAEENMAQDNAERAEERVKNLDKVTKAREKEIALAKAQGASEDELREMEKQLLKERLEEYENFVSAKKLAGEEITDDEQEQLLDARQKYAIGLAQDATLDKEEAEKVIKAEQEKQKKLLEERKKAAEERRRKAEEEAKRIADLEKLLAEEQIKNIKDAKERETAELNFQFDQRIANIKGNSALEIEILKQIGIEKENALNALNEKFEKERLEKEKEAVKKRYSDSGALIEAQRIRAETNNQETFAIDRELENLRFEEKKATEDLSNAELERLEAEHQKNLSDIDKAEGEQRRKTQQQIEQAKFAIAENATKSMSFLGDLFIKDAKKRESFQKKLALVQVGIDTAKSISSTIAGASAAAAAGGPAAPFLLIGYITSGLATVLGAFAQAKKLLGGSSGGDAPASGGNTGGAPNVRFDSTSSPTTILKDRAQPPIVKAVVVETDITKTQKRVNSIEEQATF